MSNQLNLIRTKFENIKTGETTYGFRIYDNYGNAYCNLFQKEEIPDDDGELLTLVSNNETDEIADMIENQLYNESGGISIDDEFYDSSWMNRIFGNDN